MPSILPSTAAPAPSAPPGARTTARSDEPGQNNPGSFGEALARSLEPAEEKIAKPAARTAALAPARRQAGEQKTDAEDPVNAMALPFIPFESRPAKAALPTGTAAAVSTAAGAAETLPKILDGAASAADAAVLNPLRAGAPTGDTVAAPATAPGAATASTLVSALAAASPQTAGQTPLQATDPLVNESALSSLMPLAIAGQSEAASTGFSGQPSMQEGKSANIPDDFSDVRAKPAMASAGSTAQLAASLDTPAFDTASLAITSTSAALTTTPVSVAMQAPASISASSPPTQTATATLTPEVGSNQWGKALSQQVVQMGNAGQQVAELQLNPPGLGPLKVTLSMNEHHMQAMFVSAHASVRVAVEAALPQLRATLAESGISLGNTSVGAESQQQQQQQTAFANGQGGQPERGAYRRSEISGTTPLLPARTSAEPARRNHGMRIDTYA